MWHIGCAKLGVVNCMKKFRSIILLFPLVLLSACNTIGYYSQAISGHFELLSQRQPVDKLINDPETPEPLRRQLQQSQAMLRFAFDELKLPDNGSYTRYVALQRPYPVWNVLATPELSLQPKTWCAPVVGCVAYRNYYSQQAAKHFARSLRQKGFDVYVGAVTAYSTLGWFRDPLLSSMLRGAEADLAGVLFHELAHQRVFAASDTAFSESFATTVEIEGVRRWLDKQDPKLFADYQLRKQRSDQFLAMALKYKSRLESLYASDKPDAEKRTQKQRVFTELKQEYAGLKKQWQGYEGYDHWIENGLNNAKLASVGNYHTLVPALQNLLKESGNDLGEFYRRAERLARMNKAARQKELQRLNQSP